MAENKEKTLYRGEMLSRWKLLASSRFLRGLLSDPVRKYAPAFSHSMVDLVPLRERVR